MRLSDILRTILLVYFLTGVACGHTIRSSRNQVGDSSVVSGAATEAAIPGTQSRRQRAGKRIVKKKILWALVYDEEFRVNTYIKERAWEEVEVVEPTESDTTLVKVVYEEYLRTGDEVKLLAKPLTAHTGNDRAVPESPEVSEKPNDASSDAQAKGYMMEFFFADEIDRSWDLRKTVGIRKTITRVPKVRTPGPPRVIRATSSQPRRRGRYI